MNKIKTKKLFNEKNNAEENKKSISSKYNFLKDLRYGRNLKTESPQVKSTQTSQMTLSRLKELRNLSK